VTKNIILRSIHETRKCDCCGSHKTRAPFYDWKSFLDKEHIGVICQKCAIKEAFGGKYKTNKKYIVWRKRNGKK
jgi:hypothetical protein